jgi:hypothetical protein
MDRGGSVSDPQRVFSLAEANALIPRLTLEFNQIARMRADVARVARALGGPDEAVALLEGKRGPAPAQAVHADRLRRLADEIGKAVTRIHDLGCLVKDLEMGLVDFYGELRSKAVFWCWQYGEAVIRHWHSLDEGFADRRPLEADRLENAPEEWLN